MTVKTYKRNEAVILANITDRPYIEEQLVKDYKLEDLHTLNGVYQSAYAYNVSGEHTLFVVTLEGDDEDPNRFVLQVVKCGDDKETRDIFEDINLDIVHMLGLVDNDVEIPRIYDR